MQIMVLVVTAIMISKVKVMQLVVQLVHTSKTKVEVVALTLYASLNKPDADDRSG